jgi:hypothetical protein
MAYEDLLLDELKAEFKKLADELVVVSEKRRQVFAMIQKREAEASASARVNSMNDVQKDALRHVLGPVAALEVKAP